MKITIMTKNEIRGTKSQCLCPCDAEPVTILSREAGLPYALAGMRTGRRNYDVLQPLMGMAACAPAGN